MHVTSNDIAVFTSYFGKLPEIRRRFSHVLPVSVAGKTPDGILKYGKLAPKFGWWSEWHSKFGNAPDSLESIAWYRDKYHTTVLSGLDIHDVMSELSNLSGGKDVCLICYEPPGKFCHRLLISEWFMTAGFNVKEI